MTESGATMVADRPVLSVIMPAYNEEEAIRAAVDDIDRNVLRCIDGAELIVVNDGSKDNTGPILDELSAANPRVRIIHQENGGHGAALMTGLSDANGDYLMLVDSDRQIPLEGFESFYRQLDAGYDAVFGVRRRRHDPRLRLWLTKLVRLSLRMLFGVKIHDANIPYKLLKRTVWEAAHPFIPAGTLAPSLFLAIYAKRAGYNIIEIDVPHAERATGEVSIRRLKLLKFCAAAWSQMLQFRKAIRHVG